MPPKSAWNIVAEERRQGGVLPLDSTGRVPQWFLTRLESILESEFKDTHKANLTVEQFRIAFDKLETQLAEKRQKVEADAEVSRLKAIADALEAQRWSRRIKRAAKCVVNALRRFIATIRAQRW